MSYKSEQCREKESKKGGKLVCLWDTIAHKHTAHTKSEWEEKKKFFKTLSGVEPEGHD